MENNNLLMNIAQTYRQHGAIVLEVLLEMRLTELQHMMKDVKKKMEEFEMLVTEIGELQ